MNINRVELLLKNVEQESAATTPFISSTNETFTCVFFVYMNGIAFPRSMCPSLLSVHERACLRIIMVHLNANTIICAPSDSILKRHVC